MWSTFSVCSTRVSVIIMSMTSCNLRLASSGASSSSVRFHPLGVLSTGITLPVSISYANARSSPKTDPLSLLCHGFHRHQRPSHFRLFGFNGPLACFLVSLVTSKRRPSSHAADLPAVAYGTPASASQWHFYPSCCQMPCQHHVSARCSSDSYSSAN